MRTAALCIFFLGLISPAIAHDAAYELIETELRPLLQQEVVIQQVRSHNANYPVAPSNEDIIELEAAWWAEKTGAPKDLVRRVNDNPASELLRDAMEMFHGKYTEFLVMGRHGLLVAQSSVASDYYQGDEPKYQETFPRGADAVFIDELGFDQSVNAVQTQVSFTLVDPDTGEPIGAATVGIRRGVLPVE